MLQNVKYQAEDEKLSLRWLMKKVSKQCALEVVRSPLKYSVVGFLLLLIDSVVTEKYPLYSSIR